jgi:hypothetical protein
MLLPQALEMRGGKREDLIGGILLDGIGSDCTVLLPVSVIILHLSSK